MLLKHLNIHYLTLDFSKQDGVDDKLSNVKTWSQCHSRAQRFRQQIIGKIISLVSSSFCISRHVNNSELI